MTGIDFGMDVLLGMSFFFLIYIPFINIAFLNNFDFLKKIKPSLKYITIIFFILVSCFLTLLIIRNFHAKSFKFLFIYSVFLSILTLIRKYLTRNKYKASH